jgi:hypothetical protein
MDTIFEVGDIVESRSNSLSGLKGVVIGIVEAGSRQKVRVKWTNGDTVDVFPLKIFISRTPELVLQVIDTVEATEGVEESSVGTDDANKYNVANDQSFDTVLTAQEDQEEGTLENAQM